MELNVVTMSEDSEKATDIGTTDGSNSVPNATSVENNLADTSFSINPMSPRVDDANSSDNGMSKTLPQENPSGIPSLPIHNEAEASAVNKTNTTISGRCDGSELSHFISDEEICSFLKSTLGFDTVEKFATADRFHIARRLFSWYEERSVKDGGDGTGGSAAGGQARPLKVLEAQVFSWRLQMNKIRAHHGLPPLSAGENTAPVESLSAGNEKSVSKGSSAAGADGEEVSANETGSANARKKPPNDTGDKRRKKIPEELSSAKESTAALNILSGVDDLLTVLSEEECRFLGNKFWIFTVQQLEFVLAQDDVTIKETEVETATPLRVAKCHLVDAIMKEIAKVAESSSDSSDLTSILPTKERKEGTEIEKRQISAEALTSKWKASLDARKKPSSDDVIRSFPLGGALSVLIPPALIQFLKAVGIDTTYGLIAARKTENSLLVTLFQIWQEKQGMKTTRAQNVARFLTSVSSRVQSAITSVAPADSFTRAWSGSNLIALTSSAREFIVFQCRYSDDNSFLEEQTGNIAKKLGNYRAEKGMTVLKGTGAVAVISSWRTIVKDTSDLAESLRRALPIVTLDIKTIVASRNNGAGRRKGKTNSPASTRGRKHKVSNTSVAAQRANISPGSSTNLKPSQGHLSDDISLVMHELQSNDFMQRVLKPSQAKFLQSTGIYNADSLIRADKSEKSAMVQSLIRWRRDRGFDEIPAASASKAIVDWSRKVETELNAIKQKRKRDFERGNETVVLKNDSTGKRRGDSDQSRQIKKKKRVVPKKFLERSGLDAIEALSPSAREFLSTLGVTTAEEFLSKTTSDLGSAFISWRARTGLDELKGAGAISIVSGWKGQVRDVCEYLGKQSLIDLDAAVRKKSLSGSGGAAISSGSTSSTSRKEGLSQLAYSAASRSSETLIEDEPLGPNVLDKPEDRFVSKPGILNGLSSRKFTVRGNGNDTTLYDFQLSIRSRDDTVNESSNKREGDDVAQQNNLAVCLTYRGARINKSSIHFNEGTDSKAGDIRSHSHSPSSPPITIPILSYCSLSGRQGDTTSSSGGEPFEKSHIPFCSFAPASPAKSAGGGLVDLTRFHIFPSSQRKILEQNDYANGILEAFVECIGGDRGRGNAVSKDGLDGNNKAEANANVSIVLDPATGEEQYLLCLANPIEKGQTFELVPSNTSTIAPASLTTKIYLGDPSDHRSRHGVFSLIESLAANQLLHTLEVLEKKQEVVTEQMRRIKHEYTSENLNQEASTMSIGAENGDSKNSDKDLPPTSVFISRRRIHFVATTILRQVKTLLKEDRLSQLDRSTLTSTKGRLDKLLWDTVCVEAVGSMTEGAGEGSTVLYEQLEKEITNELHFSLARQQAVGPRCPLSSQLDAVNSQLIARYALTTAGSNPGQNQQALINEMYLTAQKSAKDLHSCSESKSQDDILRLILPCKSAIDSHRHISHLPRGLPIHLASSLPNLSYTSIGEISFQYPPPDDASREDLEDSFIVLKADSGFSFTSMVLLLNKSSDSDLSLLMGALTSSTRRLDLSVDSSWYLQNQVIAPTDEMAQCGLVSWCRPIHALCAPSYSLKDLTGAVLQSLGDMNVGQPDNSVDSAFGPNRDLARSITLHLPSSDVAAFAQATRADYYPKTLPIFLRILFPHLEQKFSWKVHCGRSPDSLTYIPPETLDKRRKDASFDFTASEKRRKKTLLKMRRANAPKLPRKLRQIFITFAKSVAKSDNTDGQINVVKKADDNGDSGNDAASNEPQVPAANPGSSKVAEAAGKPAKDVIEAFVESIDFKGDESKRAVLMMMAQSIMTMFDKTIPSSFLSGSRYAENPDENISDDQSTSTGSGTKSPRESYCAEYLLWWMVLLPDLLVKTGLPLRQQQLIEEFVEALFLYFSENHSEIFTMFDYSDSVAIDEEAAEAVDISQLVFGVIEKASEKTKNDEGCNITASKDEADGNDQDDNADEEFSTTVLRDHERHLLTDFVSHTLDQVQLCFLREEDLSSGKRGTFRVGHPGIVCKHCKEAKMFYSNVSSLSACAPGIHIHCQRCKRCPKEIVDEMNEKKKLHNPQKKTLKMGSMAKFYHSLYKRMMRMRRATDGGAFLDESSSDESSDEDDTESDDQTAAEDDAQDGSNGDDVFFDHIDAIASIAEDKFYQRRNLTSAIDLYYQCVERGGLVWKTDALPRSLPDKMISEWLLKLILRRLNRGLPLISTAPTEKETSPNVPTHSVSTSVYRSTSAPNNNSNYTACSIEGCSKHRQSKCDGMCRAHWSLTQKTGVRPGAVNSTKNHATKRRSTSPGVGVEKQKGSNNSWSCHQCGEDNDPETQRCSGCKGWRGGKRRFTQNSTSSGTSEVKSLEKIPWTCHLCGKENPGMKQRCTHPCRAWRGGKRLHL